MTGPKIIFFVLAAAILLFSILSVSSRRILRAAIYLLFVLVAIAGLFYMMGFEFLAAVQLILYAGGIVVLIIFSILLTSQINDKLEAPKLKRLIPGVVTALAGITLSSITFLQFSFTPTQEKSMGSDMKTIGTILLDTGTHGYALPFEVISVLLLAILVGVIFIAKKDN